MNDTYTEVTLDGCSKYYPEIYVHVTPDHRIIRAYVYAEDIKRFNKKWIGEPSKNPLFVYLNDVALSSKSLRRRAIAMLKQIEQEELEDKRYERS